MVAPGIERVSLVFRVLDFKSQGWVDCFQTKGDHANEDDTPSAPLKSVEDRDGDLEWAGWALNNLLPDNEGRVDFVEGEGDQTTDDEDVGESQNLPQTN